MTGSEALRRAIHRAAADGRSEDLCELCARPAPPDHRHLLDLRTQEPRCVCYACSVLFQRDGAGQGHYRLIPDRRVRLRAFSPASVGVPVGLAFFVRRPDGRVLAHYPSPAGATRWEVDPETWEAAVRDTDGLSDLATDVEALLVNTVRGRSEAWLVPIDDCHRLVAIVRRHWRGMSGGEVVWTEIERFFDELRRRHGPYPGR
ncbi:DUF5947 family protein [Actinoallomurus rhizosphaericola]|uniref:DUF5947 family protein n=1 Tax=Actinoallomurus rhizosphaericola TaxID=2952536 RepID=UPI0020903AF5|nr:DUF5947 family protein [Actinoallomurus rhizosphaericola]MCO5992977.1 DUF5947 family protein [Actinoallomurus rhizosphaericola]